MSRHRLDFASGRDDREGVRRALAHLPAALFSPAERLEWKAWLTSRTGDAAAESNALRRLLDVDPANANALDRLATLATEAGDRDQARDYRRRKAEIDDAKDHYRRVMGEPIVAARFAEYAALAETLNRTFEARLVDPAAPPLSLPTARQKPRSLASGSRSHLVPPTPARRSPRYSTSARHVDRDRRRACPRGDDHSPIRR